MWFFMNGKIKPMTDSCKDLGAKRRIVVDTIKQWARIKGIEIIEGHAMPDHIHLCDYPRVQLHLLIGQHRSMVSSGSPTTR